MLRHVCYSAHRRCFKYYRMHYISRGRLDPRDFHIFNIMLHVGVSLLTMFIFRLFLCDRDKNVSFFAALLFAVHPVHAEAVSRVAPALLSKICLHLSCFQVAGIVGRADILCGLFMWFSIFFYHESTSAVERSSKLSNTVNCLLCITAAMLCKETGITAIVRILQSRIENRVDRITTFRASAASMTSSSFTECFQSTWRGA